MEQQTIQTSNKQVTSLSEYIDLLPPKQAYLFFVPESMQYQIMGKKKMKRQLFEGSIKFTDMEIQEIKNLKQHLKEVKKENIIEGWEESDLVRFILGNQFHLKNTVKSIEEHNKWKMESLPVKLDSKMEDFFKRGIFYIQGRDACYRPIFVLQLKKLNVKEFDHNFLQECITFVIEIALRNMMLPGQVEDEVFIMNFKDMGLTSIPISFVKNLIKYLQNNYRSRLFRFYAVNVPTSIWLTWKMVKTVMEETTVQKIHFINESVPTPCFEHTNRAQIEKQFGGSAEDRVQPSDFWPPKVNNESIQLEPFTQYNISMEEYQNKLQTGQLKNHRILKETQGNTIILESRQNNIIIDQQNELYDSYQQQYSDNGTEYLSIENQTYILQQQNSILKATNVEIEMSEPSSQQFCGIKIFCCK